jgi:phage terminase large subunit-like protein
MHVQRLVSVVKMATVFEQCITKKQHSVVHFLWAKGLNSKDLHKEMFPLYGGKCLLRKAVHNWVKKYSQGSSKVTDDEIEVRNFLKQESENFYAAGFEALMKQWDKCIPVGGDMLRNKSFSSFEYQMFYILYPFVTYLLTLLYI